MTVLVRVLIEVIDIDGAEEDVSGEVEAACAVDVFVEVAVFDDASLPPPPYAP